MTWTYVSEPQGMGDQIAAAYSSQGLALKAPTVPVGWAWQRVLDETDYAMYSDDRHPTFRGTYLVACLLGEAPAARRLGDLEPIPMAPRRSRDSTRTRSGAPAPRCASMPPSAGWNGCPEMGWVWTRAGG